MMVYYILLGLNRKINIMNIKEERGKTIINWSKWRNYRYNLFNYR